MPSKQLIVDMLLDGTWVCGEQMARRCSISRTAVWNHIADLKSRGYKIEACRNKGYCLISSPQKLYPELVSHRLRAKLVGKKIVHFDKIGSTNEQAFKMGLNGTENGTVVVAENQFKGKGRYNRVWVSEPGKSIACSVVLRPLLLKPRDAYQFTMLAAVSVVESIMDVTRLEPTIKWPNDIYISDKKIAGILTELSGQMDMVEFLVIGIGINISQSQEDFATQLPDAGSISFFSEKSVSRLELLRRLLDKLDTYYHIITEGSADIIYTKWKQYCNTIGKNIQFESGNLAGRGTVMDIMPDGALRVYMGGDKTVSLYSGDIRVI